MDARSMLGGRVHAAHPTPSSVRDVDGHDGTAERAEGYVARVRKSEQFD